MDKPQPLCLAACSMADLRLANDVDGSFSQETDHWQQIVRTSGSFPSMGVMDGATASGRTVIKFRTLVPYSSTLPESCSLDNARTWALWCLSTGM